MEILGFNPSHHGSVCLLEDGELKFFIQEERVGNREKYSCCPYISLIDIFQNNKVDCITWGSPSLTYHLHNQTKIPHWVVLALSFSPQITSYDFSSKDHHLSHVAHSFYNSGFKESIGVVIDGIGSLVNDNPHLRETETIFSCSYPNNFKVVYKNIVKIREFFNLSRVYETITMHLGWSIDEAGKTMGLSPYGKFNNILPTFFINSLGNPNIFYVDQSKKTDLPDQYQSFINEEKNPQLKLQRDPREWHYDESKITDLEKDLAWKVQNDTQQLVGDYIEKAIKETGLKQVCCAGGYFLNCVTNYYLLKRFPDVEFYFEPIANDSGTAIGAAKLVWHQETQDTTIRPLKSLYLGKQYSKEELLKGIKKYVDTSQ
jgi:carbamoyltransferase